MMFYVINNEYGKTLDDVKRLHPNVSFPASGVFELPGVTAYKPTTTPTYDTTRKGVREVMPANGEQAWEIYDLTVEQVRTNIANIASSMRGLRNQKLSETDWMMLPDAATDKAAVTAYRKALRDVPSQSGFPENIVWPVL
jgi:hypothetical protein